nr:hypothetical protein [Salarchaeum japonicum]
MVESALQSVLSDHRVLLAWAAVVAVSSTLLTAAGTFTCAYVFGVGSPSAR